jgi:hypothetical protein
MLQLMNETIQETQTGVIYNGFGPGQMAPTTGTVTYTDNNLNYYQPYAFYHSYPVYVCTDKTKKAIDILKHLQAKKRIKCDSVEKFIELVEEIAGLL